MSSGVLRQKGSPPSRCTTVLLLGLGFLVMGVQKASATTGSLKLDISGLGFGHPSPYEKSFGGSLGVFNGHPTLALVGAVHSP